MADRNWVLRSQRGFVNPGSPEHATCISPSKVASICGVSRWESAYTLWYRMKGLADPQPPQDIFAMGHALEAAMAVYWLEKNPGWRISPCEVQYKTDQFGFPALATLDRRASKGQGRRVVEFKIARDLEAWGDPDLAGDAPPDYVLQVIAQQLFSGLRGPAHLMCLGPFYKALSYTVEFDTTIADWMVAECRKFYNSLAADEPPNLDDSLSTYHTVKELHPDIDGSDIAVPTELITQIRELREEIGPLTAKERGLKTELLDHMGSAKRAVINGEVVARRQAGSRGGVALVVL